jgi:hypothetical protein
VSWSREDMRAAALGMTREEYDAYRARLRRDYRETFASHRGAVSALPYGILFPLLDPGAKLDVNLVTRLPTDAELLELRKSPVMWRKRRPGELAPESSIATVVTEVP